jgi:hypothetical protein
MKSVNHIDGTFAALQIKTLQSFFWLLPTLADFNAGAPGGMTNIQTTCKLLLSFEATFHVSGVVKSHNCRIWGNENPYVTCELEIAGPNVNVRCRLMYGAVIGQWPQHRSWTCWNRTRFPVTTWNGHSLTTAISWWIKTITRCLADGATEERQLPSLLGHQT